MTTWKIPVLFVCAALAVSCTTRDSSSSADGSASNANTETATDSETSTSEATESASNTVSESNTNTDSESESNTNTDSESDSDSDSDTDATSTTTTTSTTGGQNPVGYAMCPSGEAAECPAADPLCVYQFGGGTTGGGGSFSEYYSFCTRSCVTDDDCYTDVQGGMATSKCVEFDGANICALDCSFGQSCPTDLACELDMCMWEHCECSGDGCQYCP